MSNFCSVVLESRSLILDLLFVSGRLWLVSHFSLLFWLALSFKAVSNVDKWRVVLLVNHRYCHLWNGPILLISPLNLYPEPLLFEIEVQIPINFSLGDILTVIKQWV